MLKNISKAPRLLTNFFIFFYTISAHSQFLNHNWGKAELNTHTNSIYEISFAVTDTEKTNGLSRLQPEKMKKNEGLLFVYTDVSPRAFWMPETYFDLDIIFLNQNFEVIGVEENVKHHKLAFPENEIPRTKTYMAQYILELHAGEAKKSKIDLGAKLKLQKPQNLVVPGLDFLKTK